MRGAFGFPVLQFQPFSKTVFLVFVPENFGIFVFGVCCGLRFLFYFALGFRFSVFGKNKIGLSDLLFDAVWRFSGSSLENMRFNDFNRTSLILLEVLGLVPFSGFLCTPMPPSQISLQAGSVT